MDWPTRVKLGLVVAALIFFGGSLWTNVDWLRWIGIGLLFAALVLRFIFPGAGRRRRDEDDAGIGPGR